MSKKITQFFKPKPSLPKKLPRNEGLSPDHAATADENEMNAINILPAKRKREGEVEESNDQVLLSPDQKNRIERNKLKAQLIRMSREMDIIQPNIGPSWFEALREEFGKPYFGQLDTFLREERRKSTVFPDADEVWSWTTRTPIQDIKVVILGQDPYHGPGQAHGLCFSVKPGINPPPSLINMYKELEGDILGFVRPNHGHLVGWADQGVLLLNAVLTVRSGNPNSHKDKGWERLTDAVIRWISDNTRGVVFLLWGSYAQKKGAFVNNNKHHLLKATHPSPLSAHRGFLGCKHFSKCNEILRESGKEPIDWNKLPR